MTTTIAAPAEQPEPERAPYPTVVTYTVDTYGAPSQVTVNGQPVTAVYRVTTEHQADNYSEVTLTLRGVALTVHPKPER